MAKTELKVFTDAAKLDIVEALNIEEPKQFEFRRIVDTARAIDSIIGTFGSPIEQTQFSKVIRDLADKSPHLYDALVNRAFDGDALLKEGMSQVRSDLRNLKDTRLRMEDVQDHLHVEAQAQSVRKEALDAYRDSLERERERLQLAAHAEGKKAELPALPSMTSIPDEEEEEDDG